MEGFKNKKLQYSIVAKKSILPKQLEAKLGFKQVEFNSNNEDFVLVEQKTIYKTRSAQ